MSNLYYYLSAFLFCLGLFGTIYKKDLISILLSLEIMMSGVSLLIVLLSRLFPESNAQLMIIFMMIVSACEVAVALSLVIALYTKNQTIYTDDIKIST